MAAEPDARATPRELITAITNGAVQDPFPLYERLRECDEGVHWADELGGWVCTRYDDVRRVHTDPAVFSSDYYSDLSDAVHGPAPGAHSRFMAISSQQFMLSDPPAHTEIRSILRSAFAPRSLERWRSVVEEVTDTLLDELQPGEDIDVMADFAPHVPVAVIAMMLGIPPEDTWRFQEWTDAFVDTFNPRATREQRDHDIRVALGMFDYLDALVERRRADPADDLITLIATAELRDGELLDVSRAIAQLALLLAAGNETTANLIGNGITILIDNPDVQRSLCERPTLLPAAVEEMLRLDPPFHLVIRKVTEETTLGGRRIRPGQLCWQLLSAANRDPRAFEDPNVFSFDRGPNPHLAFSHGIHFCLGAHLARMEGKIVFQKLLERYPHLTAGTGRPIRKTEAIISRGWLTRPVKLIPALPTAAVTWGTE
jgi:cytochrome P450